jgi:hypothetical protein
MELQFLRSQNVTAMDEQLGISRDNVNPPNILALLFVQPGRIPWG